MLITPNLHGSSNRQNNTFCQQGTLQTALKRDFYAIAGRDDKESDGVERLANLVEASAKRIMDCLGTPEPHDSPVPALESLSCSEGRNESCNGTSQTRSG
jgi:hypothetical protein